jgi:5-methylcytosine-specific restriction endonuclease McrA
MVMMKVRDDLPRRRGNPSNSPTGKNWSDHKSDLRDDFHKHCGYCGSFDGFSHTYFEVDHFVPKSLFEKTGNISYCQYDNLVYSCKFCNNIKLSKWPSKDEKNPFANNEGFIDPVEKEYDNQVYRTNNGSIRWITNLGKWMVEIGFKFDERDFSIKLLWEMNQLRKAINSLVKESKKHDNNSEKHKKIKRVAEEHALTYFMFHQELMEFYKVN